MELVVNNVVKMEWEKDKWLQSKPVAHAKDGIFIFAAKEFTSSDGRVIPVYFTANMCFLWLDEDDPSDFVDIKTAKKWAKSNYDEDFPLEYDFCKTVIPYGKKRVKEGVLEQYGLEAYKDEIEDRMCDVIPYGIETYAD